MSADDDLRLAWQAHREGRVSRRDALLTLAVASAEPEGAAWVGPVRDFLVASYPGHLFAGFYQLDEALADRRVIAALGRLRLSFPPSRVTSLLRRDETSRGPYTGRKQSVGPMLEDLLAPCRVRPHGRTKLGSALPRAANPAAPALAESTPSSTDGEPPEPILAFYLNVLLSVATLCALVLADSRDDKRAA